MRPEFGFSHLTLGEVEFRYDLKSMLATGLLPGIFSEEDQSSFTAYAFFKLRVIGAY